MCFYFSTWEAHFKKWEEIFKMQTVNFHYRNEIDLLTLSRPDTQKKRVNCLTCTCRHVTYLSLSDDHISHMHVINMSMLHYDNQDRGRVNMFVCWVYKINKHILFVIVLSVIPQFYFYINLPLKGILHYCKAGVALACSLLGCLLRSRSMYYSKVSIITITD